MKNCRENLFALTAAILLVAGQVQTAVAKVDCSPTSNASSALPRTVAIGSNLPGTGAHALL
jgi:hypothetical protein